MSYRYLPLGEVASLQAGYGFPIAFQGKTSGDYPFAKVGDISRCGRSGSSTLAHADHFVDLADLKALGAKLIPAGSVLFAKIGEAIRQNHRAIAGRELLVDNNAMAAIPGSNVDGKFLYHYLKTIDFYCLAPATTVPALRKSDLEKLPIPCPPLPEQRRIAAILDQADALRAKRREALAQLDRLTQAIFVEMFGDPVSNPKGYPIVQLGSYVRVLGGYAFKSDDFGEVGAPVVRISNLTGDGIDLSGAARIQLTKLGKGASFTIDPGDILMAMSGATTGKIGVVPIYISEVLYLNQRVGKFRIKDSARFNKAYLLSFLRSNFYQRYLWGLAAGAAQPNISGSQLESVLLPLPPIDIQRKFECLVGQQESTKKSMMAAMKESNELFTSLQHRAFRGEL